MKQPVVYNCSTVLLHVTNLKQPASLITLFTGKFSQVVFKNRKNALYMCKLLAGVLSLLR
jgi:hypothetical protein